jgi:hypothetical protein
MDKQTEEKYLSDLLNNQQKILEKLETILADLNGIRDKLGMKNFPGPHGEPR